MATLALGVIGNALFPGVGGFLGAAVGGIVDNFLLFPALFPPPNTEGPRLDGISVTSANEGTPMNWSMGSRVRVGGAVLWMSDLEEVKKEVDIGKGGGPSNVFYEYFVSIAIGFGEAKPQTVANVSQILADVKSIYNNGKTSFYDNITLYVGDQTTPDPFLVSKIGAGNVPVFKKQVYVVIQRLFLGEYGNRVPNFQGVVRQGINVSVQDLINMILDRCGFSEAERDVDRVSACLRGINFAGVTSGKDMLERVLGTYNVGVQEINGQLQFFDKGKECPIVIDESHLSSDDNGLQFEEQYEKNFADEVSATFVSNDLNLQPGSTRYRDISRSDASRENQIRFDTPAVLSSEEANVLARRIYWQAYGERRSISFSLPQRYSNLAAGDIVKIVRKGIPIYMRIQRCDYGANGLVRVSAVSTWRGLFDQDGFGDQSGYRGSDAYSPPELDWWVGDMAAVTISATEDPYLNFGVRLVNQDDYFRGATLLTSLNGTRFTESGSVNSQSVLATTVSGPTSASDITWDEASTLIVEGTSDFIPTSATDSEVLAGTKNIIAIEQRDGEWEILGFVNVTSIGNNQYVLGRLLRGLRGTGHLCDSHLLSGAKVIYLTEGANTIGTWKASTVHLTSIFYKIAPYLKPAAEVSSRGLRFQGRSMRPFSPALLFAQRKIVQRDGAGNVTNEDVVITWARRSKKLLDAFGTSFGILAPDETPESYHVVVTIGGDRSAVLFETVITNIQSFVFTQALRDSVEARTNTDWLESSGFTVFVAQISSVVGASPYARLWVPQRA